MTQIVDDKEHKKDIAASSAASRHARWRISSAARHLGSRTQKVRDSVEETYSNELTKHLISSLSLHSEELLPRGKDLTVINKAMSSLLEAVEEDIITESEADTLLEFLAAKFIEHRFGAVLNRAFDVSSSGVYNIQALRGVIK